MLVLEHATPEGAILGLRILGWLYLSCRNQPSDGTVYPFHNSIPALSKDGGSEIWAFLPFLSHLRYQNCTPRSYRTCLDAKCFVPLTFALAFGLSQQTLVHP